ncbi:MAG: hypothetical protein U5K54_01170 [Cytophagales bacterium]|nr:hypothetical protein [Cytophagales bacterium]
MKKLEDISKNNIFEVPDGYFEKLPGIIQSRVAKYRTYTLVCTSLKFAFPMVAVLAFGIFWYSSQSQNTIEEQLAAIQTEQLVAYLDDATLNFDDLTESVTWKRG